MEGRDSLWDEEMSTTAIAWPLIAGIFSSFV